MKIIYVYNSFTIACGADRVIIEKANYLAEHGYDITIVTESQQERQPFFHLSPKVKLHDLEIDFEQVYKYNPLIRIFKYFSLMRRHEGILREYLYKERPDIVITTLGRDMLFLTDIKDGSIKIGESYIAKPYVRNLNILENKGLFNRLIEKVWMNKITHNCKKLDALVLLTNDEANNWKGEVDTFVIPSPLPFNSKDKVSCNNAQINTQRYANDIVMEEWTNLLYSLYKKKGKKIMYIFSELTIKGGTDNVITAAVEAKVKRVVFLSTDKAAYPINTMGMTKAVGEKIVQARAQKAFERAGTVLACTRYGNVMCSRGSVIPLFIDQIKRKAPITITDPSMTRFLMNLDEAVDLVAFAFEHAEPGDLFVQKADASTIGDLADGVMRVCGETEKRIIGSRHGEKLYETLVTREEMLRSVDMGHYYRVAPDARGLNYDKFYVKGTVRTEGNDAYTSHNTKRLDVDGVVSKIMSTDYVKEELEGRPHAVEA